MFSMLLLVIIYAAFISLGLPDSLLGSAWPSMYTALGVPLPYAGIISMIIAGGTVVSSILSEKVIRRFGTGAVTAFSVLATAAALTGFSLAGAFWLLCLCAVPLGLGAGSVDAALNNYVALHYKARHMSWLHCFWGIGASLGPVIMSAALAQQGGWHSGYRTIGVIQFCLVAVLFVSLPLWKRGKQGEAGAGGAAHRFRDILAIAGVKPALAAFFCYCTIETTTGLWGASFLVIVKNIAPEIAARWIALYYAGITFGRFLSGFATMKLNNRQMVRLGQTIMACGIAVLLLPLALPPLPGFFLIGLGCAPIFPAMLHSTPANFGEEHSQAIMGIQMASAYIGTTFMPTLFGALAGRLGFALFPVFIGVALVVKIVMVARLHAQTLNRKAGGNREIP